MNVEVRANTGSALALMESIHAKGYPLVQEYPQVFSPDSRAKVVVAEEGGEVHSACAILQRELIFPDGMGKPRLIQIGLIGSVSTAVESRHQGLAGSVLDAAERELKDAGCLFCMLWADDPGFYETRGYQPIGLEFDFVLERSLCQQLPAATHVRSALPGDFKRLHELYMAQDRRMVRQPVESSRLFSTPGMRLMVHDQGNGPVAYACLGRGHDLEDVVHEWAGEHTGVLACLRALLEADSAREAGSPLFMMASASDGAVTDWLQQHGAMCAPGVLGLAKILDIESAKQLIADDCEGELSFGATSRGNVVVRKGSKSAELSPQMWLDLLLPPKGQCQGLERLERQLATRFESLPWAPFLWGLDSI